MDSSIFCWLTAVESGIYRLPVELIRHIFDCLPVQDRKSLRLTCTKLAPIGIEFLSLSELHLIYTRESFARLRQVSLHPFFGQRVKSIYYEGDRLCHLNSWDAWRSYITYAEDFLIASKPKVSANQGPQNKMNTEWRADRKLRYTDQQLEDGWQNYQACYKEQKHIEVSQSDVRDLAFAIPRFPKLEKIQLSVDQKNFGPSEYMKRSFAKTLIIPKEQFAIFRNEHAGVRQYISLMLSVITSDERATLQLGSSRTGLQPAFGLTERSVNLHVLHLDAISWHIFKATNPFIRSLHRAIRHLRDLKIVVKLEPKDPYAEVGKCQEILEKGSLHSLLTSAPDLQCLEIGFNTLYSDQQPARLADISRKHRWQNLRAVTFRQIQTTEGELLSFLKEHKATLKVILIENMRLEESVSWTETLQKIRLIAPWDSALVCGRLYYGQQNGGGGDYQYDIGSEGSREEDQCAVVRDYLTRKSPKYFPRLY
ncbi:hypothetical protein MMC26_001143 [Xylographa opegraphella]|nr:hypothetical protein [Xylographa opegraphella]